jgi:hypothetical protein
LSEWSHSEHGRELEGISGYGEKVNNGSETT